MPKDVRLEALREYADRQNDALSVFRPLPHQDDFFRHSPRQFLIRGGNRSGKSTCAAVKFAAYAMDRPVTLSDGTVQKIRSPWQEGKSLIMWVIGYDMRHLGETIYRLLFLPGLFKTLRDEETGRVRAYREWDEADKKRESEVMPSAPLIPARNIDPKSWDWENKKNREFKRVSIIDPITKKVTATIFGYSSKADPKAGDPVDVIWIDEAIEYPEHYSEWKARTIDRRGNLFWSSWPSTNNDALARLTSEAEQEKGKKNPAVMEIILSMSANKALSDESREEALGMFTSEEERRARDLGEYVQDLYRMYPHFSEDVHTAIISDESREDKVSRELRASGGHPPNDWSIELILDPGTSNPGVLFCAIPPPSLVFPYEAYVVFDELYPGRVDADGLAELVRRRLGHRPITRMIIDTHAGRQTPMGFGVTIESNYRRAFEEQKIVSELGGSAFFPGCSDVGGRIAKLQSWMRMQKNMIPMLRIVTHACPILCRQLKQYSKKVVKGAVDEYVPSLYQQIDLAVCLEYWAASSPMYHPPSPEGFVDDERARLIRLLQKRSKSKDDSVSIGPHYKV